MSYRDFTLQEVIQRFGLVTREAAGLFGALPPVAPSALLTETLRVNVPIAVAISNEKVRSELVVAPVLSRLSSTTPAGLSRR